MRMRAKGCCLGVVVINVCFDVNEETDRLCLFGHDWMELVLTGGRQVYLR